MSTIKSLTVTESSLATARGLLEVAHFVFDATEEEEFARLKTPFGYLLNALSTELREADTGLDTLYREHFAAANDDRRQA